VAAAGAEVDDPVGVGHDGLVVLDDDDRLAGIDEPVEQAEQIADQAQAVQLALMDGVTGVVEIAHVNGAPYARWGQQCRWWSSRPMAETA
jgi:hypothetical protein